MITTITTLSIAALVLVILTVFLTIRNVMDAQTISALNKEIDDLQEKRITEIKESLEANQVAAGKLTEAAAMYNETGQGVVKKIEEAIEVFNGNHYAMMMKLEEIKKT